MTAELIKVGDHVCTKFGRRYLGVVSQVMPDPYGYSQNIYLIVGRGWYRHNFIKPCNTQEKKAV